MADVTTLAESAQAIFCAYADYVGESKAQQKLNFGKPKLRIVG